MIAIVLFPIPAAPRISTGCGLDAAAETRNEAVPADIKAALVLERVDGALGEVVGFGHFSLPTRLPRRLPHRRVTNELPPASVIYVGLGVKCATHIYLKC